MVFPFFRKPNQEGNAHSAVQESPFVSGHTRSMVRIKENDGIFRQSVLVQLAQNFTDFLIHCSDTVMEPGNGFTDDRSIRIIGGESDFVGVVDFLFAQLNLDFLLEALVWPNHGSTLVGGHEVEDREEGFAGIGIEAPMGFIRIFVPRTGDDFLVISGIVVGFDVVGGEIAALAKYGREASHVSGQWEARAHLLSAQ